MPEHIWSVLCYKGCVDQYTNQVSLLDVIEGIRIQPIREPPQISKVLAMPFPLHLVSSWIRSQLDIPERIQIRAAVIAPDGSEVHQKPWLDGDLESKPRLRSLIRFPSMPYRGPGLYRFAVEYRNSDDQSWQRVASVPMELDLAVPEARSKLKDRKTRGKSHSK